MLFVNGLSLLFEILRVYSEGNGWADALVHVFKRSESRIIRVFRSDCIGAGVSFCASVRNAPISPRPMTANYGQINAMNGLVTWIESALLGRVCHPLQSQGSANPVPECERDNARRPAW